MPKIDKSVLTFGVETRVVDEAYRRSFKGRECMVSPSHDTTTVVGCHPRVAGAGAMGAKPSDSLLIPLCHGCHDELDQRAKSDDWQGAAIWLVKKILFPMLRLRYELWKAERHRG